MAQINETRPVRQTVYADGKPERTDGRCRECCQRGVYSSGMCYSCYMDVGQGQIVKGGVRAKAEHLTAMAASEGGLFQGTPRQPDETVEYWGKATNPKDDIAIDKAPLHLWPIVATVGGSLALADGSMKYGRNNWRAAGVRATVYVDALARHMAKWLEGQNRDRESGLSHLDHALACLAILKDAIAHGKLVDDRNYSPIGPDAIPQVIDSARKNMEALREKHRGQKPKHWTAADNGR